MNLLDMSVGQIARQIPGSTAVFNAHGLDFCCGGKTRLSSAIEDKGLNANTVITQLEDLAARYHEEKDWSAATDEELIDHLLTRYHQVHREQLNELVRLASRVEQVHGERPECPVGLAKHLMAMAYELNAHMQKEEQVLFPMLKAGQRAMANGPISVMRHEHDDHALALTRLYALTNNLTLPKGACNTWRALFTGLQAFVDDLKQHIHLENNILFEAKDPSPTKAPSLCCGSCGG